jgi:hypothetical protein
MAASARISAAWIAFFPTLLLLVAALFWLVTHLNGSDLPSPAIRNHDEEASSASQEETLTEDERRALEELLRRQQHGDL